MNKRYGIASKIWNIIYPILMYYAALYVGMYCGQLAFGTAQEQYLLCKLVGSVLAIGVTWNTYRQDMKLRGEYGQKCCFSAGKLGSLFFILGITVCLSFSLNNLIIMSPLVELSEGYQDAGAALYSSNIWVELLVAALAVPALEEMLYRGILFRRLRQDMGFAVATVFSALIFGMMHFNIVQFVYAFGLGIAFAVFVEKTGKLYPAILAHMLANGVAVVREETGFLKETIDKSLSSWIIAGVVLLIGVTALVFYITKWKWNLDTKGERV